MRDSLTVDMCVTVTKNCPIAYMITVDKQVEFSFGGQRDGFHYSFDGPALRTFLRTATEALAQIES